MLPTLLLWSELQVPWLEPHTVYGLDDGAWSKSHRDGLDEQKVFPSAPEELDKPELFHELDELRRHPKSRSESRERELASATNLATYPLT